MKLDPPRFEDGPALLIAGLRGHFTTATWDGIPAQWERLISCGKIQGQAGFAHYGLCFILPQGIDYLSGVEVSSAAAALPSEFSSVQIPAQRYAVFSHRDHVTEAAQHSRRHLAQLVSGFRLRSGAAAGRSAGVL